MTSEDFRRLALELPEAVESSHMEHPDFRVGGKIFATLGYPEPGWAMVKLSPDQREIFVAARPAAFAPVKGAWGQKGATSVNLRAASKQLMRQALHHACRNTAPKALIRRIDDRSGNRRGKE